ncbi:hypothetical protein GCM10010245_08560 [Streptomyces spectabilis]|nr:hypothetical protein GCM10010245_08560 [Streptomyces spectabilis]
MDAGHLLALVGHGPDSVVLGPGLKAERGLLEGVEETAECFTGQLGVHVFPSSSGRNGKGSVSRALGCGF